MFSKIRILFIIMIFLLFILFFFFEKYYLIKNRPYGYNIENNILLGVKESSDPRFYKELHKLLIERDYKKLEECLRASYSNLECLGSKSNLISKLEYDSFIDDFMKKNIYFNNQSTNDIYIDIKKSGIEDFMLKENFSEWQRENNVLSRRFFYTGYNLGERLRYPPFVKEINGDISKISKKIINVLAVSDSFGEGAGNFDSDINWIAILESKLNKIESEYHFNFIKLSNIGANYNDYHRWFLDGKIKEDYFDIVLLSLNYNDLRTFGETSDKFNYIPKESIMFLNCLDRENIVFDSFINRFLPNITLAIKSNRCLANYDKHFINIGDKNNANYLDYNEMLYNYKNIVNSTNLDIFIFDLAFNISNNNVSFQDYYGDLKISDFYRSLGGFGFLFFDNYKNIDAINNNIKRCNFNSCHLFSNFKDTHYSAVTLNSIIDANLYKIREKLISSFISKNNKVGYKKLEMVKQFIIEDNYLIGVLKKDYNNFSKYIYSTNFTDDSSTITLDHALCASLGREYIRIPIKRYDAENKVFSIKFDFFQEDLLLAIGGYDSLGNQVISKFQKIRDNVTYKFSGGEESRIIIIAKESLGCNEGSWRLADFAFTLEK